MTIEQAIKKALEGGSNPTYWDRAEIGANQLHRSEVNTIFLDPSFWQSLGKALAWNEYSEFKVELPKNEADKRKKLIELEDNVGVILRIVDGNAIVTHYKSSNDLSWEQQWHRFIDRLADGKSAEGFFRELA